MKKRSFCWAFGTGLAVASLLMTGCGNKKDAAALTSKNDAAFGSASGEVKTGWETQKAAMKTNGYAVAMTSLMAMRAAAGLSPEQSKAIDETVTAINDQMYDAANRDDPAAKKAIEDLRAIMGR